MRNMIDAQLVRALVNHGDGGVVVARYGAVSSDSPCVAVPTDMGRLWMPCSDMIMRPILKMRRTWEPDEAAFSLTTLRPVRPW